MIKFPLASRPSVLDIQVQVQYHVHKSPIPTNYLMYSFLQENNCILLISETSFQEKW